MTELTRYDGSRLLKPTACEAAAGCDSAAAYLITIRSMHEIVTGMRIAERTPCLMPSRWPLRARASDVPCGRCSIRRGQHQTSRQGLARPATSRAWHQELADKFSALAREACIGSADERVPA
jgi:hypothetical protein